MEVAVGGLSRGQSDDVIGQGDMLTRHHRHVRRATGAPRLRLGVDQPAADPEIA